MDIKLEEQQNWIKLELLLTKVVEQLRIIFKNRWKSIYKENWIEKSQNQVSKLNTILGQSTLKTIGKIQMKTLNSGETTQWDLSTLSKILQKVKSHSRYENDNKNIQSAIEVRNILSHHPDKIIKDQEFKKLWFKLHQVSIQFGVSQYDISEIEFKFSNDSSAAVQEYLKLKNEANDLFKLGDFASAIKLYSKALVLPNLSNDQKGILYSKRCITYLKLKTEEMSNLALSDAQNCEKCLPNWFKSHLRVAEAQMALRNLSQALISYDKALGLEPNNVEIREARDFCQIELVDESIKVDLDPYSNFDLNKVAKSLKDRVNLSQDETVKMMNDFWEMAINKGDTYSYVLQGHRYREGIKYEQNYETAAKFYTKAALEGNPEGLYNLALLKLHGRGCKRDLGEAISMLERAGNYKNSSKLENLNVAAGIPEAQFALGRAYQFGVGVPKSPDTAVAWYKKSAENGCGPAANNLGSMYNSGVEIPVNQKLAVQYWDMAISCSRPVPRAMENLADYYLDKGDSKKAEMYWTMTKEHGNFFTQKSEEEFQKRLDLIKMVEKKKILNDQLLNEPEKEDINLPDPVEFFENLDKLKRMSRPQGPYSNVNVQDLKTNEIMNSANNGSKYASQLLETVVHNYKFLHLVENKNLNEISESDWNIIIIEYGKAVSVAEYIVRQPSDEQFKGIFLRILRNILVKNETCELDKWARICYSNLNLSSFVEMTAFLNKAIEKYPKVARFYDLKLSMLGFIGDFKIALEESEKYLKIFPKTPNLLYDKAIFLKNIEEENNGHEVTIRAFEEFIKYSEPDHRKIPKAYYCIALIYSAIESKDGKSSRKFDYLPKTEEFYRKGLEAEKLQLSMFLPYDSNEKEMISMMFSMRPNTRKFVKKEEKKSLIKIEEKKDLSYLSNPKRIQLIKIHREFLMHMKSSNPQNNFTLPNGPSKSQQAPISLAGLKEIHLVDMDPTKDKVYAGTLISLMVIDDPNPYAPSIHLVVQDDLQDVQYLCIYNFDKSKGVDKFFGFGVKITLLNPYMRMAADGSPMLRVDDPKSIIFNPGNENLLAKKLCHYCSSENSSTCCSTCKANYCSRECQMNDWKILKHKLICM